MPHPLFELGPRLRLCAEMVRPGKKLADVGTDHGYLPVWMAKQDLIEKAVAADLREQPLRAAMKNIKRYHVEDRVSARLSNGLETIFPNEADDIVIAGMGGELIASIIAAAPWLKSAEKHLVLQPMTSVTDLRAFLQREGFAVLREEACEEDSRPYTVMLAAYAPDLVDHDPLFVYTGALLGVSPQERAFLMKQARSLQKQSEGLRIQGEPQRADALDQIILALRRRCGENE